MLIACVFYASYTLGLRSRPATSGIGFFAILSVFAFLTSLPLVGFDWKTGLVLGGGSASMLPPPAPGER